MARRSPASEERRRDAEQSRARILDAALEEFADRGYAGARTAAIAGRAGVNPQLISYYFDGKSGLYGALMRQGALEAMPPMDPESSLADVVAGFVGRNTAREAWARLLVWEALAPSGYVPEDPDAEPPFRKMIEFVRHRQSLGELDPDLDPATVLLVCFAATLAPITVPELTAVVTGHPATSEKASEAYARRLREIVAKLA